MSTVFREVKASSPVGAHVSSKSVEVCAGSRRGQLCGLVGAKPGSGPEAERLLAIRTEGGQEMGPL